MGGTQIFDIKTTILKDKFIRDPAKQLMIFRLSTEDSVDEQILLLLM